MGGILSRIVPLMASFTPLTVDASTQPRKVYPGISVRKPPISTVSPYFAPELPKETMYQYLLWFILGIIAVTLFIVIIRLLNKNTESEDQA